MQPGDSVIIAVCSGARFAAISQLLRGGIFASHMGFVVVKISQRSKGALL
jgi:hypothetical protein